MKKYLKQIICPAFGWLLLAGVASLTGCQTADHADTGEMASVIISDHTPADIQQATARVFLLNGYEQTDRLTFEKQGTAWDTAAYGGWSAGPVWIKVRAYITSPSADTGILSCNAFIVTDRHQAAMEHEQKLSHSHRSECEKILNQIKARLDSQPVAGAQ